MKKDIENNHVQTGPNIYWKSLDEKYQTAEFNKEAEKEFMTSPFASEDGTDGIARRDFLKLMGASIALASTACVKRPVDYIVPYAERPPELVPGVANYYASSWTHQGETFGLVVKTREGRPIKLEGNPKHPINKNGLSALAQAQVLSLYDPDRLQAPVKKNDDGTFSKITWDKLDEEVIAQLKGSSVVVLSSSLASPSTNTLISDFVGAFKGKHVVWDTLGADDVIAGQKASYGTSVLPRYRFDQAKMIVSIDADFLGTWISPTEFMKQFSTNRKPGAGMSRLVSFESMMSLTGSNSDTRIMISPTQQLTAVMGLINELVNGMKVSRYANDNAVSKAAGQFANAAQEIGIEKELLSQIAKDLWANKGQSLVVAGGITTRTAQSLDLQVAVNFLNTLLENDGKTVDGTSVPVVGVSGSYEAMKDLIADMNAGKVSALIIHKTNPAYSLPKNSGFIEALKKVKTVIYAGTHLDETGKYANYVAPDHHHLENWGDSEVQKGVYAIQQPTIRPLYDTRSLELSLISWAYQMGVGPSRLKDPDSWLDYLKKNWKNDLQSKAGMSGGFDAFWLSFLKEGVIDTTSRAGKRNSNGTSRAFLVGALLKIQKPAAKNMELVLYSTIGHGDGSFANISWLQEFPDPVTKIVWDSYANVSPAMAKDLKIKEGQMIEVEVGGEKLKLPAHIQPGMHPKTIAIAVGMGRTEAGYVGTGIGVNAFNLVSWKDTPVFSGQEVKLNVLSEKMKLANTQGHNSMEGRQIVVQATLKDYMNNPGVNIHRNKMLSLWPVHEYKGYKWAMVIDQTVCTGCSACVVACQSENNVPVVGKRYVLEGREMHWLRLDRYYVGDESNPETVFQAMLCQQCDTAPCETVCPVQATTHDDEGLNQMTYNRCVGTRYCSNNCPYKVRRFNWFNYATPLKKPQTLALNPDVTVRTRGVMEKCTFCVQRLHVAKNIAKDNNTKVKDGDVQTACQESCPTNAIVFGDVNNPDSQVSKLFKDPRSYSVLEEQNTAPSVRYQTKVRNSDTIASNVRSKGVFQ